MPIDLEAGVEPRWPHCGAFFQRVSDGKVYTRGTWGGNAAEPVKPLPGKTVAYKCLFSAFVSAGLQECSTARVSPTSS
ncbi:MAG: hypothetical protein Kow0073_05500 [Immundisolibacter sp.]